MNAVLKTPSSMVSRSRSSFQIVQRLIRIRGDIVQAGRRKMSSADDSVMVMEKKWAFDFGGWQPDERDLLLATACVQPEEKTRLARFVFRKDFKASLIGRLLMRKFIADVGAGALPYGEVRFERDGKGKPFVAPSTFGKFPEMLENLETLKDVAFNVSHQGNYAVLVGQVPSAGVGVDVMRLEYTGGKSVEEFFRVMQRTFSAHEWRTIRAAGSDEEKIAMFCRHWALKESYVKAIGVGITVNLQEISFRIHTNLFMGCVVGDTRLYLKGVLQDGWRFEEQLLDAEHCVAVAVKVDSILRSVGEEPSQPQLFEVLTFEGLMSGAVPFIEEDLDYVRDYAKKLEKN